MSGKFILSGKRAVPCEDLHEWGKWYEKADRKVACDMIGNVRVSTVFLALDHNWGGNDQPILFETMIFGGEFDEDQVRYSTWEEAEEGHKKMVLKVKGNAS